MKRALVIGALVAALVIAGIWSTAGPPPPAPTPEGSFAFGAFGDAPYFPWEDAKYPQVLRDMDQHGLTFAINVGDIFYRPCSDAMFRRSLDWFNSLSMPLVYVPGDNEWTDCWKATAGAFAPLDRLARLRQILYPNPLMSLGGRAMPVESQSVEPAYAEFVEHQRWAHAGLVFVTAHIVGSDNGMEAFDDRRAADDEAQRRRTEAAAAWVRRAFAEARTTGATGVVIAFHGNLEFHRAATSRRRLAMDAFLTAIEQAASDFQGSILLIHGDDHEFTVDRQVRSRVLGRAMTNVTRLEVPGSPSVGWVRVIVTPGPSPSFTFEARVVPAWKFW